MLLHSNSQLIEKYRSYLNISDTLVIFSPYIKLSALVKLLDGINNKVQTIITSWKPMDIALGASDIEVFEYCKQNEIQLLINNAIHLKVVTDTNFTKGIISSANITNRGLALTDKHNFELGCFANDFTLEDKCYFDKILDSSILVDDNYYEQVKEQLAKLERKIDDIPEQFIIETKEDQKFLISNLPYINTPSTLYKVITNPHDFDEQILRCARHDLRLYNVSYSKSDESRLFLSKVSTGFKNHFFVKSILSFVGEGKYFGEVSSWLHSKIENVPSPRRYEVKEFQVRIYNYIKELLQDEYIIERPNHSEYIRKL